MFQMFVAVEVQGILILAEKKLYSLSNANKLICFRSFQRFNALITPQLRRSHQDYGKDCKPIFQSHMSKVFGSTSTISDNYNDGQFKEVKELKETQQSSDAGNRASDPPSYEAVNPYPSTVF